jgi:3-dehydroquinate dehydratase-1
MMPHIGGVQLGILPRVVLSVDGESPAVAHAIGEGIDILEARVDFFAHLSPASVAKTVHALKRHHLPVIGTIRSQAEGGKAQIPEAQRATLYTIIAPFVDALDVDLRAPCVRRVAALARDHHHTLMLSHHDFRRMPPVARLDGIVSQARKLHADVIKIAAVARDERDVLTLLQWTLQHRQHHLVTVAMGATGAISRLLLPLAGSLLTYTSLSPRDGQIPAPQLIADLRRYYPRYDEALAHRSRPVRTRRSGWA